MVIRLAPFETFFENFPLCTVLFVPSAGIAAVPNYTPAEIRDQVAVPLSQVAAELTTAIAELQSLDMQGAVPGGIVTLRLTGAQDAVADLQNFALLVQGKVRAAKNGRLERLYKKNQQMQKWREEHEREHGKSDEPTQKTPEKPAQKPRKK